MSAYDFNTDCLRTHGRTLTGKYAHCCVEWDDMPIDETCKEFEACLCFNEVSVTDGERGMTTTPKAMRFNKAKIDKSYVGEFREALDLFCLVCMFGEAKYERGNWREGDFPTHELFACVQRHYDDAYAHLVLGKGDGLDKDQGLHAIGSLIWNAMAIAQLKLDPEQLLGRHGDMQAFTAFLNETRERYQAERAAHKERVRDGS